MKAGNKCLYFCKQTFNILLGVSGLLLIAMGIFLWVATKQFSFIELSILILGGIQLFLALISMSSKKAMFRIKCYNIILGIILLAQIIVTILAFILQEELIDKAVEYQASSQESIEELKKKLEGQYRTAIYVTLASLLIQILCFTFSVWYRNSLENANDNTQLLYDEKEKKYMSFEEYSQKQSNSVKQKSNENRNEVYSRNPEFYEWKQQQQAQGKK